MALQMFDSLSAIFANTSEAGVTDEYVHDDSIESDEYHPITISDAANRGRTFAAPAGSPQDTDREDLLDQHVAYYLRHHPEVQSKRGISRIRPGMYNCDGREIIVEWHYSEDGDEPGYLIAIDGPLRQAFADYMEGNEHGTHYDDNNLGVSALQQIPKGKRLSFGDASKMYTRLEAMKVAKEQALVREKAADYVKDGMMVPQQELMEKSSS